MNQYFSPDISMLREIPKAEAEKILSLEADTADFTGEGLEIAESTPSVNYVDHLLNMIQYARKIA